MIVAEVLLAPTPPQFVTAYATLYDWINELLHLILSFTLEIFTI
jgi:hypothetical protein